MRDMIPGGSLTALIKRDWRNGANLVTITRAVGTLGIPFLVLHESSTLQWYGFALFVVMAATDKLDGWLAKHVTGSTELGKMLDPLVDKELILVSLVTALVAAVRSGNEVMIGALALALPILAIREIGVLRIKAAAQRRDQRVESAIQSGRVSMVVQSIMVAALLMPLEALMFQHVQVGLLFAAVGTSLFSWWDYRRIYRGPDA